MTSIIKVDDVQNQPGTNIISKCGTDITLGQSGDTIALACGASQTGFGRTGTVDWDTTPKTGTVTAATGTGYFVNTTSGGITVNLPAGAAGSIVSVCDYAGTAASNNITVTANGAEKIESSSSSAVIETDRDAVTFVYVDGTQGWVPVNDNTGTNIPALFVTATSPSVATVGDYKIHTFTGDGSFCVSCAGNCAGSSTVDYMVVAGGAGGGGGIGGGGGAGGYRESPGTASGCYAVSPRGVSPAVALPVSVQCYAIVVGDGGVGTGTVGVPFQPNIPGVPASTPGDVSSFSSISSAGGGYGRHYGSQPSPTLGGPGGSGGGGSGNSAGAGGPGNDPVTDPVQGMDGGNGNPSNPWGAGGGGGATTAGASPGPTSGPGGTGGTSTINNTPTARAGGGGGGGPNYGNPTGGSAGTGGGGAGHPGGAGSASAGTPNTGGGGGGGQQAPAGQMGGAAGGTGIVIIRYKFQ